jgi:hypothetical protein
MTRQQELELKWAFNQITDEEFQELVEIWKKEFEPIP